MKTREDEAQYSNRFRYACQYSGNFFLIINAKHTSMYRELRSYMYECICDSLVTIYVHFSGKVFLISTVYSSLVTIYVHIQLPMHCNREVNKAYSSLAEG